MRDRYESDQRDVLRAEQVARDERDAGRVEGDPWDEFTDGDGPERL